MNKAFENILERLEEMIHPKRLYLCRYAHSGCRHLHDEDEKDCRDCVVELAKEIAQEVAEEYNNGWIPCSERLPDKAGYDVLATLENRFGQRRVAIIFTGYGDGQFWHCNHKEYDLEYWKVIAWQPLPEPYQKGELEGE